MTNEQYSLLVSELRDDLLSIGYSAMTAVAAGPTFNPAWAAHCNTYIGLGRQ